MSNENYRYEYKYIINTKNAALVKHQLGALLCPDEHADCSGEYFVRSVYFDDDSLSAYHEKLSGINIRNKYRLRFYNLNPERLVFEAKRKHGQLVTKNTLPISRLTAERMLSGGKLTPEDKQSPLLAEFDALTCGSLGIKPSVIVDYTRTAFLYPLNNVRITLDSDICAEKYHIDHVFKRYASVPVLESDTVILEVKFSDWLPPFIAQVLSVVPKILCANSKYCNCIEVYY